MTCRDCKQDFIPRFGKPGYINQCENCADDVELLGGNMIWEGKQAPYIEVKPMAQARQFATQTKRFGHGVLKCITESKATSQDGDAGKANSGTENGAMYYSKLGEKRSVKL